MSSRQQQNRREAAGQRLFLWLKIIGFLGFLGVIFALGGNPFTGELGPGTEETSN